MSWIKNKQWKNGKSYVDIDELTTTYLPVLNKLALILYSDEYYIDTKDFARNILEFAIDHEYITWKQAYALEKIETTDVRRVKYGKKKNNFIYYSKETSDYEKDQLTNGLFGRHYFPEELEDGGELNYREDGSRYFTLPV